MVGSLGSVAAVVLLILLVQKERIAVAEGPRARVLVPPLNITIAPLLMAFVVSMAIKVLQDLRMLDQSLLPVVDTVRGVQWRVAFVLHIGSAREPSHLLPMPAPSA
jgi:hypothetical protein